MNDTRHLPQELTPLEWEAFCYLVGELPAESQARFEQRLGEDDAACLALARVTALSLQVADAPSMAAPRLVAVGNSEAARPTARRVATGLASSALAACLAATAGLTVWMSSQSSPNDADVASNVPSTVRAGQDGRESVSSRRIRDLIVRWRDASLQPEPSDDDSERHDLAWLAEADGPLPAELSAESGDEFTVPSWMLAAVSLGDGEPGDSEDEVWEN